MIKARVTWTKINGKLNASMQETEGFGYVLRLEVGRSMVICGDYGVTTSMVEKVEMEGANVVRVTTKNSVYLVEACR